MKQFQAGGAGPLWERAIPPSLPFLTRYCNKEVRYARQGLAAALMVSAAAAATMVAVVTATVLVAGARAEAVTLQEIKAQTSLKSSNAWGKSLVIGAATNYNEDQDWYWEVFKHHFDITTAENGCKMKQVLWNEGKYKFAKCDSIVLDRVSVPWRGHALIWGATDSTLGWMPSQGGAAKNSSQMRTFIQNYVSTVLGYYKSKSPSALCWDTVNEAVRDTATGASSIDDALKVNDYSSSIGSRSRASP